MALVLCLLTHLKGKMAASRSVDGEDLFLQFLAWQRYMQIIRQHEAMQRPLRGTFVDSFTPEDIRELRRVEKLAAGVPLCMTCDAETQTQGAQQEAAAMVVE